jgi:NADH-quinone oxidoreductase subunit M
LEKPDVMAMGDLKLREIAMFAPLVALVVWMGVYPTTFQSYYAASLDRIVATNEAQLKQIGLLPLDQQKQQKKEAAVHATAEQGN